MIGRLRGTVAEYNSDGSIVLDVGGVGYEVHVPLGMLQIAPGSDDVVTLYIHTHVREDIFALYGFRSQQEKQAFRTVLTVSGVGPKLALSIFSAISVGQLASAVSAGDQAVFKGISGVGKKTAERLLLELRDKLHLISLPVGLKPRPAPASVPALAGTAGTVVGALVSMGYKMGEAETVVQKLGDVEGKAVEDLLRQALSLM